MVPYTFDPSTQEAKAGESEASLGCVASSKPANGTLSGKKKKTNNKKQKAERRENGIWMQACSVW